MPSIHAALEDPDSNRHFFDGDTCLKNLVKLVVILRYGRHSGRAKFENEIELRRIELQSELRSSAT